MSIRAGSIVMVGGRNVIDRLQSAGLSGDVPIETIREIGNDRVVDKIPGDPDYTFSMESWDVTTELAAFLTGQVGVAVGNPAQPPGAADGAGTEYRFEDMARFLNVTSPWKDNTGAAGGNIGGGCIIPGFFPTRIQYRFGVTDMASQTVELGGGSYFYAENPPVEEYAAGDGVQVAFVTSEAAWAHRLGGALGTTFRRVFGVLVNGVIQVPGVDFTEAVPGGTLAGAPAITTINFVTPPPVGAQVRFTYFTDAAKAFPQTVHPTPAQKPGAVRGRDIRVRIDRGGANRILGGIQTVELDATIEGAMDRELGNPEPTGRQVNGTDTNGTVTQRPKDRDAFFRTLSDVTGVSRNEVFGYFNQNTVPVDIEILDPKNPGTILKTIYIADAQFQPPGLPARVNQATDFPWRISSVNGTFSEFKGARP